MLVVVAPEAVLVDVGPVVEVLASKAALALDRIRLTDEINRHASDQYFRALVQNASDLILIVGGDGRLRYASPSTHEVLEGGRPGRLQELVAVEDWPAVARMLERAGTGQGGVDAVEVTVVTAAGRRVRMEVSCRDLRADPAVGGLVVTLHDVTEQRRLQRELTYLAFHDALTGLANRVLFYERLEQAMLRGAHEGRLVAVLFADVDDLKAVNDSMGHAAGDQLLVAAAHRFAGALGEQDTVARWGGDEFAALLEGLVDARQADDVAERVVAAFREPFQVGDRQLTAGVSIGVATAAAGGQGEDLLRRADLALYHAKSAGKARWRRFTGQSDPGHRPPPGQTPNPGHHPGGVHPG